MQSILALTVQITTALVFASAAFAKLRDRERFRAALRDFAVLPDGWTSAAAFALPLFEAGIALGLITPQSRRISVLIAAALLLLFGAVITVTLVRGRTIADCGCTWSSGVANQLAPWMAGRNLAHAIILGASLAANQQRWVLSDVFAACAAATALALLYHAMPGLLLQQIPRSQRVGADRRDVGVNGRSRWT
jgi:hypothetical protein